MSFNSSSISFPSTQLVDDMMDFFDSPLKKYLKLKKTGSRTSQNSFRSRPPLIITCLSNVSTTFSHISGRKKKENNLIFYFSCSDSGWAVVYVFKTFQEKQHQQRKRYHDFRRGSNRSGQTTTTHTKYLAHHSTLRAFKSPVAATAVFGAFYKTT